MTLPTMLTPNVVPLLLFLLLPLWASAVAPSNALALLEAQSDLTLITALVKRDPELVKLYSTVKNATIVAAVDSSFPIMDPNSVRYSNRSLIRVILQDIVIRGVYPTSAIAKNPIYPSTFLTNPRYVDTSRGSATSKLVELNGKKTVTLSAGSRANITQGNLRFKGGILHKISNPLNEPASFRSIASTLNITSISQLSERFVRIFELITGSRDTTFFAITNEASEALGDTQQNETVGTFVDALAYYVVTPGIYFENEFTGKSVKALNGADLTLSGFGTGTTKVNDAVVVRSDIFATNGVLHIIDRPLNPMPK